MAQFPDPCMISRGPRLPEAVGRLTSSNWSRRLVNEVVIVVGHGIMFFGEAGQVGAADRVGHHEPI